MKSFNFKTTAYFFLFTLSSLLLPACETLKYRNIQDTFEVAVQADNPRGEGNIFTQSGYDDVLAALTVDFIDELDPRLQPNAYLLRSMSNWRIGELNKALDDANKGDALQQLTGSRDHVLLALMRSLIAFAEVEENNSQGELITQEVYRTSYPSFKLAMEEWDKAMRRVNAVTPESTTHYLYYHRWRTLSIWQSSFIDRIDSNNDGVGNDDDEKARLAAINQSARLLGGTEPIVAARLAKQAVPEGPLRILMESMGLN